MSDVSTMGAPNAHGENVEFSAGVLDVVRTLIGYLISSATISPETIREKFKQIRTPERSGAGAAIQRVIDDLDRIVAAKKRVF